jgi:hypothetical protein
MHSFLTADVLVTAPPIRANLLFSNRPPGWPRICLAKNETRGRETMETTITQTVKTLALLELETYFSIVSPPFSLQQIRAFQTVYQRLYLSLNHNEKRRLDEWAKRMNGEKGQQAATGEAQKLPSSPNVHCFFGVCRQLEFGRQLTKCLDGLI